MSKVPFWYLLRMVGGLAGGPAGSVPTFYFESIDADVLERQGSCS